jgi:glycosyltransferase involved in cell wall biosynthesis
MRPLILHLAPFLWSGAGSVITRLCEHQQRLGPVAIATTGASGGLRDWPAYRTRLRRAGVRHVRLDGFHRDPERFWASAAQLTRLLDTTAPAVVHAHAGVPTALAVVAAATARQRPRIVGQMYSWGPDRPAWMDQQDVWAFSQADRVVYSAHTYGAVLRAGGVAARRLVYLPWGLPLDALPWRMPRALHGAAPRVGFVGRIEPRKGQLALVEAFARLRRAVPAATLHLVGPVADRAYAAEVGAAIRRHRLSGVVHLDGHVPDVPRVLRDWDLFVSLSDDEGQGLAVLEAMATGVPVVARQVPGIEDFLVDERTGWAVPGTSTAAAAAAMRRALADASAARRISRRARRLVEQRYDWARMLAAFDRIYEAASVDRSAGRTVSGIRRPDAATRA